jgi:hypothetical protein
MIYKKFIPKHFLKRNKFLYPAAVFQLITLASHTCALFYWLSVFNPCSEKRPAAAATNRGPLYTLSSNPTRIPERALKQKHVDFLL